MALRKARRAPEAAGLNITSMMDMMTIILVFLLKNFGTNATPISPSEQFRLPTSTSTAMPEVAVDLVVARTQILVDGLPVVDLEELPDPEVPGRTLVAVPEVEKRGQVITRLHERLLEKATTAEALALQSGDEAHAFQGRIRIQGDRQLPFSVLREVMYTAGQARFGEFSFVVYRAE